MVSFRKLFTVLAVAGLFLTGVASAQISGCSMSADNRTIRAEGLTELVGSVFVNCTAAPTTGTVNAYVSVKTDGPNVTNRINSSDPPVAVAVNGIAPRLFVNPGSGTGTAVVGAKLRAANQLDWDAVPVTFASGATGFTMRIDNIRVNATQAGGAGSNVRLTVNVSAVAGEQVSTLVNSQAVVATVQTGMTFSVTALTSPVQQCLDTNATPPATPGTNGADNAVIKFTPGFPAAFKTQAGEEAGAETGTRLIGRFYNVPASAKVFVFATNVGTGGWTVTLKSLSGGTVATTGWVEVKASSSGAYSATWEITGLPTTGSLSDPVLIPVVLQTEAGKAAAGTLQVNGNLAPVSSTGTASTDAAIPRFSDVNSAVRTNLITIVPCSTTLLFPYVTSVSPWETGVAITNTTQDVQTATGAYLFSGTTTALGAQSGTCTLNYFSNDTATGATNPAAQTTATIAAGKQTVFLVGGGSVQGDAGVAARPNFSGYIVANCNFQYAHGFAFMTSGTGGQGGVGYNALVIPAGRPIGTSSVESLGQ